MDKTFLGVILILGLGLLLSSEVMGITLTYIDDSADILSSDKESLINDILQDYYENTNNLILLFTLESIEDGWDHVDKVMEAAQRERTDEMSLGERISYFLRSLFGRGHCDVAAIFVKNGENSGTYTTLYGNCNAVRDRLEGDASLALDPSARDDFLILKYIVYVVNALKRLGGCGINYESTQKGCVPSSGLLFIDADLDIPYMVRSSYLEIKCEETHRIPNSKYGTFIFDMSALSEALREECGDMGNKEARIYVTTTKDLYASDTHTLNEILSTGVTHVERLGGLLDFNIHTTYSDICGEEYARNVYSAYTQWIGFMCSEYGESEPYTFCDCNTEVDERFPIPSYLKPSRYEKYREVIEKYSFKEENGVMDFCPGLLAAVLSKESSFGRTLGEAGWMGCGAAEPADMDAQMRCAAKVLGNGYNGLSMEGERGIYDECVGQESERERWECVLCHYNKGNACDEFYKNTG